MKTIFRSALIVCAALTAGLAGCQKGGVGDKHTKSVSIYMTQEAVVEGTRAAAAHVGAEAIIMNDARVYFVTAGGDIMSYVDIDFSAGKASGYDPTSKTVGSEAITATGGTEITGVPGSVTRAVIVANLPMGASYLSGGNMSQFNAMTVEGLYDVTDKGVAKVALFGSNALTHVGGARYSSKVEVAPIGARFELGSIAGDFNQGGVVSKVKSFTLEGIYINNYYPTMSIDCLTPGAIVNNGTVVANYNGATAPSKYASFNSILADYSAGVLVGQGTSPFNAYAPVATPTANNVWAYNVLTPVDGNGDGNGDVPHIVVRISDVVTSDGVTDDAVTYAGTKFLTVRNVYLNGSATPLVSFERGYVYRIVKLGFAESHLTPNPEMTTIDITVEVEVMTWVPEDVDYDFD